MKQYERIIDKIAMRTDLHGEALPTESIIEMLGTRRLLVEHHRGVTKYAETDIIIRMHYGGVHISGKGLYLAKMSRQQIIICGKIEGIRISRGEQR